MNIEYRPLTAADIDATTYIRKAALEYLDRSQGRDPWVWQPARQPHSAHILAHDPDCAWAAVADGTVVGYSMGFVRGDIWFLSQLFVQPEMHAGGIGAELLRRAVESGRAKGARIISVVSSTSPVAQALYMRAGMAPLGVAYRVSGPAEALRRLPEPEGNRNIITECSGWQERVAELDRSVWGADRAADHTLFLSDAFGPRWTSFALNQDGALRGYGYAAEIGGEGHIGPFASYEAEDQLALLRMAGDWLGEQGIEQAYGMVIATNATVMRALLYGGWKLGGWTFFLASERFGQFDRYVPSGGLML